MFTLKNCKPIKMGRRMTGTTSGKTTRVIKYIGVYQRIKSKKFYAQIRHSNLNKYLGSFDTAEEAAQARDDYLTKHGIDVKLNFPRSKK